MTVLWDEVETFWRGTVLMAQHPYGWAAGAIIVAFVAASLIMNRRPR